MLSWVTLFAPGCGTVVKDMDLVGDHCVLVARTSASKLILIVVPLTRPEEAYTVQVSVRNFLSLYLLLLHCCISRLQDILISYTLF